MVLNKGDVDKARDAIREGLQKIHDGVQELYNEAYAIAEKVDEYLKNLEVFEKK